MAAQALVLESYKNPVATYATNVMGTAHLLESVRRAGGVRAVVIVTSDKCYENREWVWPYRECEPLGGYDPYSSSKGCAEIVTAAYRQSFFNPDQLFRSHDGSRKRPSWQCNRWGGLVKGSFGSGCSSVTDERTTHND